jgi:hypothetical protein
MGKGGEDKQGSREKYIENKERIGSGHQLR